MSNLKHILGVHIPNSLSNIEDQIPDQWSIICISTSGNIEQSLLFLTIIQSPSKEYRTDIPFLCPECEDGAWKFF